MVNKGLEQRHCCGFYLVFGINTLENRTWEEAWPVLTVNVVEINSHFLCE